MSSQAPAPPAPAPAGDRTASASGGAEAPPLPTPASSAVAAAGGDGDGDSVARLVADAERLSGLGKLQDSVEAWRKAAEASHERSGDSVATARLWCSLAEAIARTQEDDEHVHDMIEGASDTDSDGAGDGAGADAAIAGYGERMLLLRRALGVFERQAGRAAGDEGGGAAGAAIPASPSSPAAALMEGAALVVGADGETPGSTLRGGADAGRACHLLGMLNDELSDFEASEALYRAALHVRERALGEHVDTAKSLQVLANLLEGKYDNMADAGDDEWADLEAEGSTGGGDGGDGGDGSAGSAGGGASGEAKAEEDGADGAGAPSTGDAARQAVTTEALAMYRRSMEMYVKVAGDHEDTADAINNLGSFLRSLGGAANTEKAERHFLEALAMRKRVMGPDSAGVADMHYNLGGMYESMDEYERALEHMEEASRVYSLVYPEGHERHEEAEEAEVGAEQLRAIVAFMHKGTKIGASSIVVGEGAAALGAVDAASGGTGGDGSAVGTGTPAGGGAGGAADSELHSALAGLALDGDAADSGVSDTA